MLRMPNRFTYEFAIIRVVPKVERGEYINVGVILFSKQMRYLRMKYHLDESRLNTFSEGIDIDALDDYLKAWVLVCKGHPHGGLIGTLEIQERFRWLTAKRSTIIQSSEVHPGRCTEPEKLLDDLFEKFVL